MNNKSLIVALLTLLTFPSSLAFADAPTADQKKRFMKVCLEKYKKQHVCDCTFKGNAAVLNRLQMDMVIANISKNKTEQARIKANPKFDNDVYNQMGTKALLQSVNCLIKR